MRKIFAVVLLLAGCREAPEPFRPIDFEPADPARLTYSVNDDRVPAWTTSNDSVLYVAESYPPYDSTPGIVLSVPRASGVARPILDAVQVNVRLQPWLTAPAVSADGKSVAFFEMTNVIVPEDCDSIAPISASIQPLGETRNVLQQAVLRVRAADNINAADNAQLVVNFAGRTLDDTRHPVGLPYVIVNVVHPFQRFYERDRMPVFRASWSPDGSRLVYSDGLQLRIWTVGASTSTAVPNTNDAVLPAWSPDGSWIAYSALQRGTAHAVSYTCFTFPKPGNAVPVAAYEITYYDIGDRGTSTLTLIKPDGTGAHTLGAGEAPAWSPDGKYVVVHRNGSLAKVDVATGAETAIPATQQSFEPAVSRDGKWVAFAKFVNPGNYDIWVAPF